MFCSKCGEKLGESNAFCHSCGAKVIQEAEAAGIGEVSELRRTPPEYACYPSGEENESVPDEVLIAIEALEAPLPPGQKTVPASRTVRKEKEYFGFPALVFCLTVIALLSVACGVLAMLYFGGF
ncbi:MAG: zinc ribbon domain-containing protein [Oscillospiraceae bacterium]|nr:zinc ribbon domain-containing protein [Oscillospiraceae bacterium]